MPLNKVMLIGNVGKDPEVRYLESAPSQQGQNPKVAQFPLATSERYRDRNGELHETTEWHNIVAWRGLAETIEKYVKKGSQLYVEGKIRTRSWTDQAGAKQYRTEIVADNVQLLGRRPDAQQDGADGGTQQQGNGYPQGGYGQAGQASQQGYSRQNGQPAYAQQQAVPPAEPTDDLPF